MVPEPIISGFGIILMLLDCAAVGPAEEPGGGGGADVMSLFEARNLHKRFGNRVVLENISLSFEEGRVSGIMGPNGAGKTTCFHVLTGQHRPDRGEVLFDGRPITGLPPQRIATLGISRSFQIMSLFDDSVVIENVMLALPAFRQRRGRILGPVFGDAGLVEAATRVLEQVGLAIRNIWLHDQLSSNHEMMAGVMREQD